MKKDLKISSVVLVGAHSSQNNPYDVKKTEHAFGREDVRKRTTELQYVDVRGRVLGV